MSTLSAAQRGTIQLAYYAGPTHFEVSAYLGIPGPTPRTRIRDGIKHLETSLRDV